MSSTRVEGHFFVLAMNRDESYDDDLARTNSESDEPTSTTLSAERRSQRPASATMGVGEFPPPPPTGGRYMEVDSQSESSPDQLEEIRRRRLLRFS